ncbi:MAG TPA: succinate dehydrogenase, cytochrome b556 subunit [Alphaproteobacteria bacterium]|nr:succinate dehydrogenase, cytochrome b556 subunit [Alphaproteobacteria bacterium]
MAAPNRPLSPHISIYRPQMTSVLSILHRIAGVGLGLGALLLTFWVISAATGPDAFATAQGFMGSWFGLLLLFGFTLALFYHLANGIRHLFWDAGFGFQLPQAYASGVVVLIAAAVLTAIAWIWGVIAWGGAQ